MKSVFNSPQPMETDLAISSAPYIQACKPLITLLAVLTMLVVPIAESMAQSSNASVKNNAGGAKLSDIQAEIAQQKAAKQKSARQEDIKKIKGARGASIVSPAIIEPIKSCSSILTEKLGISAQGGTVGGKSYSVFEPGTTTTRYDANGNGYELSCPPDAGSNGVLLYEVDVATLQGACKYYTCDAQGEPKQVNTGICASNPALCGKCIKDPTAAGCEPATPSSPPLCLKNPSAIECQTSTPSTIMSTKVFDCTQKLYEVRTNGWSSDSNPAQKVSSDGSTWEVFCQGGGELTFNASDPAKSSCSQANCQDGTLVYKQVAVVPKKTFDCAASKTKLVSTNSWLSTPSHSVTLANGDQWTVTCPTGTSTALDTTTPPSSTCKTLACSKGAVVVTSSSATASKSYDCAASKTKLVSTSSWLSTPSHSVTLANGDQWTVTCPTGTSTALDTTNPPSSTCKTLVCSKGSVVAASSSATASKSFDCAASKTKLVSTNSWLSTLSHSVTLANGDQWTVTCPTGTSTALDTTNPPSSTCNTLACSKGAVIVTSSSATASQSYDCAGSIAKVLAGKKKSETHYDDDGDGYTLSCDASETISSFNLSTSIASAKCTSYTCSKGAVVPSYRTIFRPLGSIKTFKCADAKSNYANSKNLSTATLNVTNEINEIPSAGPFWTVTNKWTVSCTNGDYLAPNNASPGSSQCVSLNCANGKVTETTRGVSCSQKSNWVYGDNGGYDGIFVNVDQGSCTKNGDDGWAYKDCFVKRGGVSYRCASYLGAGDDSMWWGRKGPWYFHCVIRENTCR
jgi:hypothetical protein